MSSIAHRGFVHLGMDVSKDSIAVAVLSPDRDVAEVDKVFHDAESVRRLVKRIGKPKGIWACCEAGPTGYDLQRLLASMGVRCDVVAPSLIPKGSGDRVKTDRRDARRLAGLHRAGELTPVAIPTPAQEGVRDLCRTRGDMVQDLTRARNRLSGFLLRHSVVWRGGSPWTERHRRWLATLSFDDPAIATTYSHYLATVKLRDAALESVEADLLPWCTTEWGRDSLARRMLVPMSGTVLRNRSPLLVFTGAQARMEVNFSFFMARFNPHSTRSRLCVVMEQGSGRQLWIARQGSDTTTSSL